jgi:hypothetical protein
VGRCAARLRALRRPVPGVLHKFLSEGKLLLGPAGVDPFPPAHCRLFAEDISMSQRHASAWSLAHCRRAWAATVVGARGQCAGGRQLAVSRERAGPGYNSPRRAGTGLTSRQPSETARRGGRVSQ